MNHIAVWSVLGALALGTGAFAGVTPLDGTFTYQGKLASGGTPVTTATDFKFRLYDAAAGPAQVGGELAALAVTPADDGTFTVDLDFGAGIFLGSQRWLEIDVNNPANGGAGPYTTLSPRQPLFATPYAQFALSAPGTWTQQSGQLLTLDDVGIGVKPAQRLHVAGNAVDTPTIALESTVAPVGDQVAALFTDAATGDFGIGRLADDGSGAPTRTDLLIDAASGTVDVTANLFAGISDSVRLTNYQVSTYGSDGLEQIRLWGPSWGEILLNDFTGNQTAVLLSANGDSGGLLQLRDGAGSNRAVLSAGGGSGLLTVSQADGSLGVQVDGDNGTNNGGLINLRGPTGTLRGDLGGRIEAEDRIAVVEVLGGDEYASLGRNGSGGGVLRTYDELNNQTVIIGSPGSGGGAFANFHMDASSFPGVVVDGDDGNSGQLLLNVASNVTKIEIDASNGTSSEISMFDADGTETIEILAAETSTQGGQITLRRADGTSTIFIDGDFNGDGRITTQELEITGGSDLSEQFDVISTLGSPEPGMVVCIDPANPGKLTVSTRAYDRTVAGIISGAGGIKPGMLMGQKQTEADGQVPIALTGRVYVMCDASNGSIQPGDLLTSSDLPGHAMKVTDYTRAQGAILGKAMTALEGDAGLVLVLVSLQ